MTPLKFTGILFVLVWITAAIVVFLGVPTPVGLAAVFGLAVLVAALVYRKRGGAAPAVTAVSAPDLEERVRDSLARLEQSQVGIRLVAGGRDPVIRRVGGQLELSPRLIAALSDLQLDAVIRQELTAPPNLATWVLLSAILRIHSVIFWSRPPELQAAQASHTRNYVRSPKKWTLLLSSGGKTSGRTPTRGSAR